MSWSKLLITVAFMILHSSITSVNGQVQLVFRGVSYPNNSVLELDDIGNITTGSAISCTTNKSQCCAAPPNRFGQWYYPNGSAVPNNAAGYAFYRGRWDNKTLFLNRRNDANQSQTGSFCCELPDDNDVNHRLCVSLVEVSITPVSGSSTAGEHYKLSCTITGVTIGFPIFSWFLPSISGEGDTRLVSYEMPSATTHTSILQFDPLKSSHEGKYTCQVTVEASRVMTAFQVNVTLPLPNDVTVTASPNGPIIIGFSLVLTCSIKLSAAVDVPVTVNTVWSGPNGTLFSATSSIATILTATTYTSTATISSITADHSGAYNCSASVSLVSDSTTKGGQISGEYTLTVVLPTPIIVSTDSQSTSITVVWTQEHGDAVELYKLEYSYIGPCPGVVQSEMVSIDGDLREYVVEGLHEFSNYTLTITAIHGDSGSSLPATVTTATLPTVPRGQPRNLTVISSTPFSITVQWSDVECLEQNSIITGYSVTYWQNRGSLSVTANLTGADHQTFTGTGLLPRYNWHPFSVAAVSDYGIGPYNRITDAETTVSDRVGLILNGVLYANNSIVTGEDIGWGGGSLLCFTNNTDCCRYYNSTSRESTVFGEWFLPNDTTVAGYSNDFRRGRSSLSTTGLHSYGNYYNNSESGVFRCVIPDASGINQTLYVGVYSKNKNYNYGSPFITNLFYNRSILTLTCTSTGGPATNVTWMRNGQLKHELDQNESLYSQSKRVVNTTTATYENTLTGITVADLVGSFTCTVTNSRGSSTTNITVTLNGVVILGTSQPLVVGGIANISCVSDAPATKIEWLDSDGREVAQVIGTSVNQLDLIFNPVNDTTHNSTYTCQVTRGDGVFEENITISVTVPPKPINATVTTSGKAVDGEEYTLMCKVSVIPGLTKMPIATWLHQNGSQITSDERTTISPSTLSPSSVLKFTSLHFLHGGKYTCQGMIKSPALDNTLTVKQSKTVIVKIPTPTVNITTSPDENTHSRVPSLILACTIKLSKAVDIPVSVNTILRGPTGTQFTSLASKETESDTTYTSTASFSSSVASDSGDYTCQVTIHSTSSMNFVQSSEQAIATKTAKDVLQRFQLKLRRTDDCITWNAIKANEVRSYIFGELQQAISSRCHYELPKENLFNGVFSCLGSHEETTYRSTIIGTQTTTATQLEECLQDWVTSDPTLTIQWYAVKLDPMCPVSISSLGEAECVSSH